MTTRSFVTLAVVLSFILALPIATQADNTWGTYHWARKSNPFTLLVVDSVTADWDIELDDTLYAWPASSEWSVPGEWSASTVLNLSITSADESKKTRKRCRMVKGQIRVCNAVYGYTGWLGMATIGIDSNGHIDRGTAKVNDSYGWYWDDQEEKNHVMCQEVGHLFGLGHTSVDGTSQGTCMDYSSHPDSEWPNEHDYEQLADIYADLDSYNSYDDGTDDSTTDICNAPPGKGCNKNNGAVPMGVLLHSDHGHEIWPTSRKDGGVWLHHVRLAPDDQ